MQAMSVSHKILNIFVLPIFSCLWPTWGHVTGDMWQGTWDMQYVTLDMWHVTCDTLHVTPHIWRLFFLVSNIFLFCDLPTHCLFCDLHTLLENGKAGATAQILWIFILVTVDLVRAKYKKIKINKKKIYLNDNKVNYCDYLVTYRQVMLE